MKLNFKKKILILILLFAVYLGATYAYQSYLVDNNFRKDIIISTNKTEYKKGEMIRFVLRKNSSLLVDYYKDDFGVLDIERLNGIIWNKIERPESCCGIPCWRDKPGYYELKEIEYDVDSWDQEEGLCKKSEKAQVGIYRAVAKVKINDKEENIYSNEFAVK